MRLTQKFLKNSGITSVRMYSGSTPSVPTHCFTTFRVIFFISSSAEANSRIKITITSLV